MIFTFVKLTIKWVDHFPFLVSIWLPCKSVAAFCTSEPMTELIGPELRRWQGRVVAGIALAGSAALRSCSGLRSGAPFAERWRRRLSWTDSLTQIQLVHDLREVIAGLGGLAEGEPIGDGCKKRQALSRGAVGCRAQSH